jgi:hypothetical protein
MRQRTENALAARMSRCSSVLAKSCCCHPEQFPLSGEAVVRACAEAALAAPELLGRSPERIAMAGCSRPERQQVIDEVITKSVRSVRTASSKTAAQSPRLRDCLQVGVMLAVSNGTGTT